MERPIVPQRHGIAGKDLGAHLALYAVRGADHGHLDRIFELRHASSHHAHSPAANRQGRIVMI
jgi:hypothetical protein